MSGGYVDSARETLEDMGYFDGMDDGNESEGGKTAAKCPHCGSADTVPCCPDINGEYFPCSTSGLVSKPYPVTV